MLNIGAQPGKDGITGRCHDDSSVAFLVRGQFPGLALPVLEFLCTLLQPGELRALFRHTVKSQLYPYAVRCVRVGYTWLNTRTLRALQ